jgi:hypothetical protein
VRSERYPVLREFTPDSDELCGSMRLRWLAVVAVATHLKRSGW